MAMANKSKPDKPTNTGIRPLSPVPENSMDHSGLPGAPKTPEDTATSPLALSPELLTALASNPAALAAVTAALSPPTAPVPTATAASSTLVPSTAPTAATSTAAHLATAATSTCLLYTSPSPRDRQKSRMPSSA